MTATTWRFGARSDVGLHREGNEDSFFAGSRLLVVADGVGGAAAGEIASSIAIEAMQPLEDDTSITDPLEAMRSAIRTANRNVSNAIDADHALSGMGTTLSALFWVGDTLGMAQLGDSRGYRLRDGELNQITTDHTLVQSLVDEGQITPEEALVHPRRSWILRALDGRSESEPDLEVIEPEPGDRYLLCSDGLSDYVDLTAITAALDSDDPQLASERLVDLALKAGAPDNVTCIVADIVEDATVTEPPLVGGAAATPREPIPTATPEFLRGSDSGRQDAEPPDEPPARRRRSLARPLIVVVSLVVVLVVGAAVGTYVYVKHQWYVGEVKGKVAVYHGVKGSLFGHRLQKVDINSGVPVTALPETDRQQVIDGKSSYGTQSAAAAYVDRLKTDVCTTAIKKLTATATSTATTKPRGQLPYYCVASPTTSAP